MKLLNNNIHGFSLIEILLVLLIIGIVSSFALPNYKKYIKNSRLDEAKVILLEYSNYLQKYYNDNNTYKNDKGEYINLNDLNEGEDLNKRSKYFDFIVKFDKNREGHFILKASPNNYYKEENRYLTINQYNNIFICKINNEIEDIEDITENKIKCE